MQRRALLLFLVILTALAAALRLVALGHEDLWLDEIFTATVAREPTLRALFERLAADVTPPLTYVLVRASLALEPLVGLEAAVRLPSALAGAAAPALGFLFARARAGTRAAVVAAALATVHAALVAHAREARFYAIEASLAALFLWLAERASERGRARDGLAAGAVGALLVLCHTLGAALVAARLVWLVVEPGRRARWISPA